MSFLIVRKYRKYQIWHDRATFHFLTSAEQIEDYLKIANEAVSGFLTIGTFSESGPTKCSNPEIKRLALFRTLI